MELFGNAREIADFLLAEEGMDGAMKTAFDGIERAHAEHDYYLLSVWREVRNILRERSKTMEAEGTAESDGGTVAAE